MRPGRRLRKQERIVKDYKRIVSDTIKDMGNVIQSSTEATLHKQYGPKKTRKETTMTIQIPMALWMEIQVLRKEGMCRPIDLVAYGYEAIKKKSDTLKKRRFETDEIYRQSLQLIKQVEELGEPLPDHFLI